MANDDQRRGADCFQSSSGWSWGVGVSVVLLLTWSEISPVKRKHRHAANLSLPFSLLAILPICPLTVGVLFGRCDKTGCLYISADIFKFVFSQTSAAHHDWERDIYQLWYLPPKLCCFSLHVGAQNVLLCTSAHKATLHKSLWAVSMTSGLPQDVRRLSVCIAASSSLKENAYLEPQ